ncbi:hypothetical protein BDZ91DRAFT_834341 [Kalaharituber pfeilii]|nr:hypothetical protein BDZ91DRAFT_834341 [Kalaharituber pfeilii]
MQKTNVNPPVITLEPQQPTPRSPNGTKRPSLTMQKTANKVAPSQSGTNSPTTPRLGYRASQPTLAQGNIAPATVRQSLQPFIYASEAATSSATHLTPRLSSTSIASPQAPITSPQQLPLSTPRGVKFVYANGVEEILEPRRKAPSTSDGSSRPPSPILVSPGLSPKPPSSTPSSVLSSPAQKVAPPPLGRRASIESKVRHGRALSVGANGVVQEVFMAPEPLRSPVSAPRMNGTDEINPTSIAMTLKMREELAANARRERKVMDLEISNASLLAINRTLERKMRKQTSELRRYRRLARAGELQPKSTRRRSSRASNGSSGDRDPDSIVEDDFDDLKGIDEERDAEDEEEGEEDEEDEEEDDESTSDENETGLSTDGRPKQYKAERALATDNDRVSAELQKHQALLDASAKTDALLQRCQFMIEEMVKEAKKALEYKVAASDVKLGGRILGSDNEEEEDEEDNDLEETVLDAEGLTETDVDDMTGTDGETTDDGGGFGVGDDNEGDVTETEDEGDAKR